MKFEKTALTFEQQVEKLIVRGLVVDDVATAVHTISHTNYYRLAAYFIPHYLPGSHEFKPGTKFATLYSDYEFDKRLRNIVVSAIECVEISVRTRWAYEISHAYGPHGYLVWNSRIYKSQSFLNSNISELRDQVSRSREPFIEHYRNTYDEELPPAWVACEVMSFGLLSKFYGSLSSFKVRRAIASGYGLDEGLLAGLLEHLANVRNICAHHGRLWNRRLPKPMPLPRNKPRNLLLNMNQADNLKARFMLYNTLVMLVHLLQVIEPDNRFSDELVQLIHDYNANIAAMGFPVDWNNLPIWSKATTS